MVSDRRVRRLVRTELTLELVAAKAGMDAKTARKYLWDRRLPSEMQKKHEWRTRLDPFAEVREELRARLEVEPGLQAKTLFEHLQQNQPGRYADGQLRTLQRQIKHWRATEGPAKEVFFAEQHQPGELCQSDFTHCRFVLSYSNRETGSICYSESFESLSEGLQKALWELGGVPRRC
jgi:hypothetical protein